MATQRQRQSAFNALHKAICAIEAAQNTASAKACAASGALDQSAINSAKSRIYDAIKGLQ